MHYGITKIEKMAREIESQVVSMVMQFEDEELVIFENGETSWLSALDKEFKEDLDAYLDNVPHTTVKYEDYAIYSSREIIDRIKSILK